MAEVEKKVETTEESIFIEEENLDIPEVKVPDYALVIKDLYKSYGRKDVLKGLNVQVKKGEVFGFIGKMVLVNQPLLIVLLV